MSDDWVIVDTCVWASFFSKHGSPEKRCVEQLLNQDRVAVIGPIVVEVLTGFRIEAQADWVASRLRNAHCIELEWEDWRSAARLGRQLAAIGKRIPVTDTIVAACALRRNLSVCTVDPDFDNITGLRRDAIHV